MSCCRCFAANQATAPSSAINTVFIKHYVLIAWSISVQRSLRLSLSLTGAAALALAGSPIQPVVAQGDGSAADLGVMEINLKDAVQFNWGFQGALQGAGTPNQAGIGAFLPIAVGENSVWFIDALANANFADFDGYSSIINTEVAGTTISTSTRLGYRWLNGDRSWMYGINAGYDSRPMNTGDADTGVTVWNKEDVFGHMTEHWAFPSSSSY